MKKQIISVLVALLLVGSMLAGCGNEKPNETKPTDVQTESSEATVPETSEATTPSTSEATVPTASEATVPENTQADAGQAASGKYVDLDNMQFSINGKTYTLGKTTLQEMIDDGVPFVEEDIVEASNTLRKNSQSIRFRITLGEYWTAQVQAFNDTDEAKPASECYISQVYVSNRAGREQDVLKLAFPLNVTLEEMRANAGEPTAERHSESESGFTSDALEYTRESTKYYGSYGYKFEFSNGVLSLATIDYLP